MNVKQYGDRSQSAVRSTHIKRKTLSVLTLIVSCMPRTMPHTSVTHSCLCLGPYLVAHLHCAQLPTPKPQPRYTPPPCTAAYRYTCLLFLLLPLSFSYSFLFLLFFCTTSSLVMCCTSPSSSFTWYSSFCFSIFSTTSSSSSYFFLFLFFLLILFPLPSSSPLLPSPTVMWYIPVYPHVISQNRSGCTSPAIPCVLSTMRINFLHNA